MWTLTHTLPGGHRLFRDEDDRTAIADRSGATPDLTDDGVLYLDPHPGRWPRVDAEGCYLPLISAGGEESTTAITVEDLLIVAEDFFDGRFITSTTRWRVTRER